ncbi:MAG: N-acetylmuramoyl-L-alanine amidase [Tannerellaceae bacterium]|nr:N-acetylmuramoyl-L-alanine amidase [Tannerellaceae bacterium]
MGKIETLIIHCSASRPGSDLSAADIDRMHRQQNGWKMIGYHYVVRLDGSIEPGRPEDSVGAHASGWNATSIGICYIGGLNQSGKAEDTRTPAQKQSLIKLIKELCAKYPIKQIIGHRDTSPDLNGNGVVDPWERIKECPCFDAIPEYEHLVPKS